MDWIGFFSTILTRVPFEKILFTAPDRSKDVKNFLTTIGSPVEENDTSLRKEPALSIPVAPVQEPEAARTPNLPTREETTAELKRRLARELYKAELDLAGGLKIAGKPCDCLSEKHTLLLEAAAEELISADPFNPVYTEIIQWIKDNQPKVTPEAIESDQYRSEYPHMASKFKDFRKRVVGTAAFSALGEATLPLTLDEAKKLAANEAVKEVERQWHSQEKK